MKQADSSAITRRVFHRKAAGFLAGMFLGGCRVGQIRNEKENRPNILICIADDWSYGHAGAYGCKWVRTPAFDRIAQEGLLFNNAYTPSAKCAPSRACFLTGRNPWQLKEAANQRCHFPPEFKTFPEVLAQQGYYVGFTGKGWGPGEPGKRPDGSPRQLCGMPFNHKTLQPPTAHIRSIDYAANFELFLDSKPDERPFCFWYGGYEPHRPYEWDSGEKVCGKNKEDIDKVYPFLPDHPTVRQDLLDYACEIEWFDYHLQRILNVLERRALLDNTLVIVTSDNGMSFPRIKGNCYIHSNRMPMAIMWHQGIRHAGRTIDAMVSFIDVAPTILEVAGIDLSASGMAPMAGNSLADLFVSSDEHSFSKKRNFVLIGREWYDVGRPNDEGYPVRGIVTNRYLYLMNFYPERWPVGNPETGYPECDPSPTKTVVLDTFNDTQQHHYWQWSFGKRPAEEFYDLNADPDCLNNQASNPAYEPIKRDLKQTLLEQLKKQEDPRIDGRGQIFEQFPSADKFRINYYEKLTSGQNITPAYVNPSDIRPWHSSAGQ